MKKRTEIQQDLKRGFGSIPIGIKILVKWLLVGFVAYVYDQTELAEWLKASFESLAKYNTKTLRAKLRATDGGYRIRLLDNLKEYIQK